MNVIYWYIYLGCCDDVFGVFFRRRYVDRGFAIRRVVLVFERIYCISC